LIDEQSAPQTVFDEPPATPEAQQPDRLNIQKDQTPSGGQEDEGKQ
jgi:hypothetical protein